MSTIHNKKVVVKVGTNVLTQAEGLPHITAISQIVDQLAQLKKQGFHIILVSSGAVGAGKGLLGSSTEMNKVVRRQVYAAVGQIRLMNIYSELLANYGLHCAQLLATKEDFRDRSHYLNMKNCFQALLRDQIIPIVNENDVVAVSELMFTDNDELAGLIASMINAHAFIILSNVDGVYNGPPNAPDSQLIPIIESDDKKILAAISPSRSSFGRGGMSTKFRIARKAAQVGIHTYVANGRRPNILIDILNNDFVGTYFKASAQLS
ncbi:MAG: glutamate 5-kinase, partial [Bacteroidota bacterium]